MKTLRVFFGKKNKIKKSTKNTSSKIDVMKLNRLIFFFSGQT